MVISSHPENSAYISLLSLAQKLIVSINILILFDPKICGMQLTVDWCIQNLDTNIIQIYIFHQNNMYNEKVIILDIRFNYEHNIG